RQAQPGDTPPDHDLRHRPGRAAGRVGVGRRYPQPADRRGPARPQRALPRDRQRDRKWLHAEAGQQGQRGGAVQYRHRKWRRGPGAPGRRRRGAGTGAGAVPAADHRRAGRRLRPARDHVRDRVRGRTGPPGSRQQLLRPDAMTRKSPLLRNPVLVLVFALPVVAIIAGVGLLVMALRTGGDDPVLDEVRRTARGAQVTDLSADEAARAGRYGAVVRIDPEAGAVEVLPVSGRFVRSAPLYLVLSHPITASEDMQLQLRSE